LVNYDTFEKEDVFDCPFLVNIFNYNNYKGETNLKIKQVLQKAIVLQIAEAAEG